VAIVLALAALPASAAAPPPVRSLRIEPASVQLDRPHAQVQLVVTGVLGDGSRHDLTHSAAYSADEAASVGSDGIVRPKADGRGWITVSAGGISARVPVSVENAREGPAPGFRGEVAAILSRTGCNSGSCHGAFVGKGGFRLSLFAHEPDEDFFW